MLKREIYIKNIGEALALLSYRVAILNAVNLYDINIMAEDFYPRLLNLIYGYKLKNANTIKKNAPAIDLVDEINRVAIQVTSDNSSEKIKKTIDKFINNEGYKSYDRLIVLILTNKKKYSTIFNTDGLFLFDEKKDIWDMSDLIKQIRTLDIEYLKRVNEYLDNELTKKYYQVKMTQASEVETIIALVEYISKHKKVRKTIDVEVDPEYKIYKRFEKFADRLTYEYKAMLTIYGDAINTVNDTLGIDEAQEIITMLYLQDISMKFLNEKNDNPIEALEVLVQFFEDKLSQNGKNYDRVAIKFYLVNEMIKCRVFPNERSEYDGSK